MGTVSLCWPLSPVSRFEKGHAEPSTPSLGCGKTEWETAWVFSGSRSFQGKAPSTHPYPHMMCPSQPLPQLLWGPPWETTWSFLHHSIQGLQLTLPTQAWQQHKVPGPLAPSQPADCFDLTVRHAAIFIFIFIFNIKQCIILNALKYKYI